MATQPQSLNDFLSGVRLTELFRSEAIKTGVPDPFPEFGVTSGNNPIGTKVQWEEITGNRKLAQLVNQTGPAKAQDQPNVRRMFATALGSKEEMIIEPELLYALKQGMAQESVQPGATVIIAENAKRELVRRAQQFRSRFDNLKSALKASVIANGAIYVDGSGNVLPTSSGSGQASVLYSVPTGNKFTKNGSGSTYNIGDWSSASTDIPGKLRALKTVNIKANGYPLTTIVYGQSIVSYLAANTNFQEYLKRNQVFRDRFVDSNEIPDGILGFKWKPASESFFVDQAGATQSWFPDNFLAVHPDVTPDWYEFFECGTMVPRTYGQVGVDLDSVLGMAEPVFGLYSFAVIDLSMVARQQYGWFGLPTLKVPGTFYFGTCS